MSASALIVVDANEEPVLLHVHSAVHRRCARVRWQGAGARGLRGEDSQAFHQLLPQADLLLSARPRKSLRGHTPHHTHHTQTHTHITHTAEPHTTHTHTAEPYITQHTHTHCRDRHHTHTHTHCGDTYRTHPHTTQTHPGQLTVRNAASARVPEPGQHSKGPSKKQTERTTACEPREPE